MLKIKPLLFILIFIGPVFLVISPAFADNNITIDKVWINEAPPTVTVLAGYARITNNSENDVTLNNISSPEFTTIEIHRSFITDGMAHMEKQNDLIIPAGKTIEFRPGDYHLMLFDPKTLKKSGQEVMLNFCFSNGETISVTATIERRDNMEHEHHH